MSFYRSRWIAATRKTHRCDWCDMRIEAGLPAEYAAGRFVDFYAGYLHPECAAARDSIPRAELEGGWDAGSFSRGRPDDRKEPPIFSPEYRGEINQ